MEESLSLLGVVPGCESDGWMVELGDWTWVKEV